MQQPGIPTSELGQQRLVEAEAGAYLRHVGGSGGDAGDDDGGVTGDEAHEAEGDQADQQQGRQCAKQARDEDADQFESQTLDMRGMRKGTKFSTLLRLAWTLVRLPNGRA